MLAFVVVVLVKMNLIYLNDIVAAVAVVAEIVYDNGYYYRIELCHFDDYLNLMLNVHLLPL